MIRSINSSPGKSITTVPRQQGDGRLPRCRNSSATALESIAYFLGVSHLLGRVPLQKFMYHWPRVAFEARSRCERMSFALTLNGALYWS